MPVIATRGKSTPRAKIAVMMSADSDAETETVPTTLSGLLHKGKKGLKTKKVTSWNWVMKTSEEFPARYDRVSAEEAKEDQCQESRMAKSGRPRRASFEEKVSGTRAHASLTIPLSDKRTTEIMLSGND